MSFCVGVSPQKRVLGDYPKHTHHVVLILNTHATWFNTKHAQAAIRAQQYIIIMASNKYNPMIGQAPKCCHCRVTIATMLCTSCFKLALHSARPRRVRSQLVIPITCLYAHLCLFKTTLPGWSWRLRWRNKLCLWNLLVIDIKSIECMRYNGTLLCTGGGFISG